MNGWEANKPQRTPGFWRCWEGRARSGKVLRTESEWRQVSSVPPPWRGSPMQGLLSIFPMGGKFYPENADVCMGLVEKASLPLTPTKWDFIIMCSLKSYSYQFGLELSPQRGAPQKFLSLCNISSNSNHLNLQVISRKQPTQRTDRVHRTKESFSWSLEVTNIFLLIDFPLNFIMIMEWSARCWAYKFF